MSHPRRGLTLVELLVSTAASTVLMGGLASTLYVASQSFQADDGASADEVQADDALGQLLRDAQAATAISELTPTAVTLTVPDRDGDGAQETLRYDWSGAAGDPLTYQYNGNASVVLASDVRRFELSYLARYMEGVQQQARLLFLSAGPAAKVVDPATGETKLTGVPTVNEQKRIDLLASWGYAVDVLPESLPDEIAVAVLSGEWPVVYFSGEATSAKALTVACNGSQMGVVSERSSLVATFGLGASSTSVSASAVTVNSNSHPITSGYALSSLTVLTSAQSLAGVTKPPSDASVLASTSKGAALLALEAGKKDSAGLTTSGRRVQLPWGGAFDVSQLNANGKTILQRAILWAAEPGLAQQDQVLTVPDASPSSPDQWFQLWLK